MITKEMDSHLRTTTVSPRRSNFTIPVSALAIRLLIAFVISWLIVLAFFISGVVSR